MAGHPSNKYPTALIKIRVAKYSKKNPRGKRKERKREKFSPDSQTKPRCAHVLRTAPDLKISPKTRAPTCTPCGETGSESSWLRVARWSNLVLPTDSPKLERCKYLESFLKFDELICEINCMI